MTKLFEIENPSIEEVETTETRSGVGSKSLTLVHPGKTKMHMRRAVKGVGSGVTSREVCWLCVAHNGSYIYINDDSGDRTTIVITDQDLNP